jgi:predicted nucleotidyltransferase
VRRDNFEQKEVHAALLGLARGNVGYADMLKDVEELWDRYSEYHHASLRTEATADLSADLLEAITSSQEEIMKNLVDVDGAIEDFNRQVSALIELTEVVT